MHLPLALLALRVVKVVIHHILFLLLALVRVVPGLLRERVLVPKLLVRAVLVLQQRVHPSSPRRPRGKRAHVFRLRRHRDRPLRPRARAVGSENPSSPRSTRRSRSRRPPLARGFSRAGPRASASPARARVDAMSCDSTRSTSFVDARALGRDSTRLDSTRLDSTRRARGGHGAVVARVRRRARRASARVGARGRRRRGRARRWRRARCGRVGATRGDGGVGRASRAERAGGVGDGRRRAGVRGGDGGGRGGARRGRGGVRGVGARREIVQRESVRGEVW